MKEVFLADFSFWTGDLEKKIPNTKLFSDTANCLNLEEQ